MKKYKLIREYPGSREVGTIVEKCTFTGSGVIGNNKLYTNKKGFGVESPENYPEFWEEVRDYAYQIISFSSNRWNDRLAILDEDGIYTTTTGGLGWSLKKLLEVGASVKSGDIKIHSVKRISDGEIFTIGDKAKTTGKDHSHTITSFRIKQYCIGKDTKGNYLYDGVDKIWVDWEDNCGGNWLEFTEKVIEKDYEILISKVVPYTILSVKRLSDGEVFTVGDSVKVYEYSYIKNITEIIINSNPLVKEGIWLRYDSGSSHLSHANKAKQPIFLTHDGKDIFVGDTIWWVRKESFHYSCFEAHSGIQFFSDRNSYFLTKEAAEEYINKNKPLFTTEDGVAIYSYDTTVHWVIEGKYQYELNTGRENVKLLQQQPDTYKVFSTKQAAEYYVLVNAKVLSIEDFWNFVSQSGSNVKKQRTLKELVKERLDIE